MVMLVMSTCSCAFKSNKEKVSLSVWVGELDQDMLEQMAASFTEHYSSEADFEITVCEEREGTCKDTVLFSPETAADVYCFADDQINALIDSGALLEIDYEAQEVIEENGGERNASIIASSRDGKLYAYPCTASNGYFLYYNSDYITPEEATSFEAILDKCEKTGKKFGMEFTSGWYLYAFFKAAGLDVHSGRNDNFCDWNATCGSYKGTDVVESLINLVTRDSFVNVNNDELVEGVKKGDIVACFSGTWNASLIEEAYGTGYEANMLPTFKLCSEDVQLHSVAGYKLVGVNSYSENTDWAQKFARWITNEENQLLRFELRGEGPSNIKAAQSDEVQASKAIASLTKQSQYGHIQRVPESYWEAAYRLANILMSGNIEGTNPQELLNELVKAVQK